MKKSAQNHSLTSLKSFFSGTIVPNTTNNSFSNILATYKQKIPRHLVSSIAFMAFLVYTAFFLFACELESSDGDTTPPYPVSATVLTSTETPSNVRDRYAVFKITSDKAYTGYKLAIAPQGTALSAADMTNVNNLGVHTYDLTANTPINVLMGFAYNAKLLSDLENGNLGTSNPMIFDHADVQTSFKTATGSTDTVSVAGTNIGAAGDIAASMLQPGTQYTLYGLAAGDSPSALLTFTTDPLDNDISSKRSAPNTLDIVDSFGSSLTIVANNYNLYPMRIYISGNINVPQTIADGLTLILQDVLRSTNPALGYVLIPGKLSDYTSETGTTATDASVLLFWHSFYLLSKKSFEIIEITHITTTNGPQNIRFQ